MTAFKDIEDNLVNEPLSKTRKKEQMNDLQTLGIELVGFGKAKLAKLDLPQNILEAVKEAQRLTANGAIRRQYQYIGKLMRHGVDADELRKKIDYLNGDSIVATRILHLSEHWRDKLLDKDDELQKFVTEYDGFDIGELRSLIRLVRKERDQQQNKNYTKLFRTVKLIIEGHE
ncbi:MAG: ribosome biogenesis factor YjgA [Burkholderiales bacterium]|nr:ribosome biogenesis factor YjgA [Burkholderiales bacterium]